MRENRGWHVWVVVVGWIKRCVRRRRVLLLALDDDDVLLLLWRLGINLVISITFLFVVFLRGVVVVQRNRSDVVVDVVNVVRRVGGRVINGTNKGKWIEESASSHHQVEPVGNSPIIHRAHHHGFPSLSLGRSQRSVPRRRHHFLSGPGHLCRRAFRDE